MSTDTLTSGLHVLWPDPLPYLPGGEVGLRLLSDLHVGAHNTDYDTITEELSAAALEGDRILINGDVFDLILPGDRKRFTPSVLHPRLHGASDLINKVVDWAFDLLVPHARLIDVIGAGNHETATEKIHSLDPALLLVDRLNDHLSSASSDHRILYAGYCAFVCYRFQGKPSKRFNLYMHHGAGKSSSPAASAGDYNRLSFVEGADVYWLGHLHARMNSHHVRLSPPARGEQPVHRDVRFVRTGAYLRPYAGQSEESLKRYGRQGNYAADSGCSPHGNGGARLLLTHRPNGPLSLTVQQ